LDERVRGLDLSSIACIFRLQSTSIGFDWRIEETSRPASALIFAQPPEKPAA
jgi:hypothetical protein